MRALIAYEFSGRVRDALIDRGHDAWSCDIEHGEGHNVHRHIHDDIHNVLSGNGYELVHNKLVWPNYWDMLIAFPPCTYLCVSGNAHYANSLKRESALLEIEWLLKQPIERIALENPVGVISTRIRKPDQIIQPWWFGDDASKKTCLWLKGLKPLLPTNKLPGNDKTRRANQTPSGQNKLGPSPERSRLRSITYKGIASAMA